MALSLGCGSTHVITEDGDIFGFGRNRMGQIGLGFSVTDQLQRIHVRLEANYRGVTPVQNQNFYHG